jgi:SAM-dependent methyltransferase
VLELGVGYGRVLSMLASQPALEPGRELWGLDIDRGLIALAESRLREVDGTTARLVHGDMCSFELERTFDRILIPYNAIYCLTTEQAVEGCFERVRRHLSKRGRLVMDAYTADDFARSRYVGPKRFEHLVTAIEAGRRIEISERSVWDESTHTVTVSYRYAFLDSGKERIQVVPHYARPLERIRRLAENAGLDVFSVTAAFREAPVRANTERWVLRAQRARTTGRGSDEAE